MNLPAVDLRLGDCLDVLRELPDESVHAIICDPPYGLSEHKPAMIATALTAWLGGDRDHVPDSRGFMGAKWDAFVPPPAVWDECLRVLTPGGHLAAFAGSRTYDLMTLSIRLAGFEIRDGLQWLYGSGMPKGQNVGKAIDKMAGAEREVVGRYQPPNGKAWNLANDTSAPGYKGGLHRRSEHMDVTAPATPEAARWEGWNTSLKPSVEPIVLARKPLQGTVAATVLAHGTGALNVDATRVGSGEDKPSGPAVRKRMRAGAERYRNGGNWSETGDDATPIPSNTSPAGRWPANVLLTHAPECHEPGECAPGCPVAELDAQSGTLKSVGGFSVSTGAFGKHGTYGAAAGIKDETRTGTGFGDEGGASRFFPSFRYQAKAPARERPRIDGKGWPTVKPQGLMRWLVRLLTPPSIPYVHCVSCGYDSDPLRRVREDVSAKARGADPLLDRVSTAPRRPGPETPARPMSDVRQGAYGEDPEVLLDSVSSGSEPQAAAGLPGVRDGVSPTRRPASDLLPGVRSGAHASATSELRGVREAVPADREQESILRPDVRLEGVRSAEAAARPPVGDGPGIRRSVPARAPDGGSPRDRAGAPEGNGGPSRPATDARRGRAPHQRDQDGQPDREPAAPPQGGARPDSAAATAADHLSALQRPDQGVRPCPSCGADLRRVERPGVVLDPFAGTSATLQAARDEGFASIGIERDKFAYLLSRQRLGFDRHAPDASGAALPVETAPDEVAEYAPTPEDIAHDQALAELLGQIDLFDLLDGEAS